MFNPETKGVFWVVSICFTVILTQKYMFVTIQSKHRISFWSQPDRLRNPVYSTLPCPITRVVSWFWSCTPCIKSRVEFKGKKVLWKGSGC